MSKVSKMPVPGEVPKRRPKARKSYGGRAFRRPEEDVPGPDYIERMKKLGARSGESLLAFTMRIAGIEAGRQFVLEYGKRCDGNLSEAARQLGVNRHNLALHLKNLGLQTLDLLRFREEA